MLYESERGDFSLMLLGDVMPTRRLAVFGEERYLKLREICVSGDFRQLGNRGASLPRWAPEHQRRYLHDDGAAAA